MSQSFWTRDQSAKIVLAGGKPRYHYGNRQPLWPRDVTPLSLRLKRPLREGAGESSKGAPLSSFSVGLFRPDPWEGFVLLFRPRRKDASRAPPCLSTFQLFRSATGQPASLCVRAQTRAGHLGSRERTPLEGRCLGNPGVQISRGTG